MHQQPRSPAEVNPQIPTQLAQIILKALAKRPAERFANAGEFLEALKLIPMASTSFGDTTTIALESSVHSSSVHNDADLDRIGKDLAAYIGPIALILVRRAAPNSQSMHELYQTLAQEISSVTKREQFLASMPKASLNRSAASTPSGDSRTSG